MLTHSIACHILDLKVLSEAIEVRGNFFHSIYLVTLYLIYLISTSGCGGGSWGTIRGTGSASTLNAVSTPFISKWEIQNAGDSITLPLPSGFVYNFTIDWGDGSPIDTITSSIDPDRIHTYSNPKVYTLTINGTLPAWSFNNTGDKDKILQVTDFGSVGWRNLDGAFYGCKSLTVFRGGNTSGVISMENMFKDALYVTPNIARWDTGNVVSMANMFAGASNANPDVSRWDTKRVANMSGMFFNTHNANPDVSNWNTEYVTNMRDMFKNAIRANPNMSSLNLSNITDMTEIFSNSNLSDKNYTGLLIQLEATNTNPDINLDVGIAKYRESAVHARSILMKTRSWTITDGGVNINPPVTPFTPSKSFISVWNIDTSGDSITLPLLPGFNYNFTVDWGDGSPLSTVTSHADPNKVHTYAKSGIYTLTINGTLPAWSFNNTGDKDKIIQVLNFGSVGWTNLDSAFYGCNNLRAFRGGNTSEVTSMRAMFKKATYVTPDTVGWDTKNVVDMSEMFSDATKANPDVTNWDTRNVTNMSKMFSNAINANPNVAKWDTKKVTNMSKMFLNAHHANPDVSSWNTKNVVDMSVMFANAYNVRTDVSSWDTGNVVQMNHMFSNAYNVNPNVTNWNTENVIDMSNMFYRAYNANPNISNWNTRHVVDMSNMFSDTYNANPDMSSLDFSSVTNMSGMFTDSSLSEVNYTNLLIQLEATSHKTDVILNVGTTRYQSNAIGARSVLVNNRGWKIMDGGLDLSKE